MSFAYLGQPQCQRGVRIHALSQRKILLFHFRDLTFKTYRLCTRFLTCDDIEHRCTDKIEIPEHKYRKHDAHCPEYSLLKRVLHRKRHSPPRNRKVKFALEY